MKIKFSKLVDGAWVAIETRTEQNYCYPCPDGHKTCFKPTFTAFEQSGKDYEEGELKCWHNGCKHTFPYRIQRIK